MLLGICTLNALLLGGLFWLIFSLTAQNARAAEAFSPSPSLPLETPSPSPVPAAVPSMPAPAIKEDWYEERNRQLYTHMRAYGDYPDDAAIYRRIDEMQIDKAGKMVALTFDDGPYSPYTDQILEILEENGARATFFIKGDYIEGKEYLIEKQLALGCEIGDTQKIT